MVAGTIGGMTHVDAIATPSEPLMCDAATRAGSRCQRTPRPGHSTCYLHERATEQRAGFSARVARCRRQGVSATDLVSDAMHAASVHLADAVDLGDSQVVRDALAIVVRVVRVAVDVDGVPGDLTPERVDREIARLRAQLDPPSPLGPELTEEQLDLQIARLHAELDDDGR
jgi:hypothetical protein